MIEDHDQGTGPLGRAVDMVNPIEQGDEVGGALGRAGVHQQMTRNRLPGSE